MGDNNLNDTEKRFIQMAQELNCDSIKEMLEYLYWENTGVIALGKIFNISGPTMHGYLRKFNIEMRPKGGCDPMIDWEIIAKDKGYSSAKQYLSELFVDYSFSQIGAMFRCSVSTIFRAFKKYKINVNRKKKRAKKEIIDSMNTIQCDEKIVLCSCCGTRPVAKGFKYLCVKCYGKN